MAIKLVLAIMITGVAPIFGAAQPPPMVNVGAGARSCGGEWLTLHDKGAGSGTDVTKVAMMLSWVQGYVIGSAEQMTLWLSPTKKWDDLKTRQARYGTISGWVFDPPDADAMKHWVTKFCRDNPLEPISTAGAALVAELFAKN